MQLPSSQLFGGALEPLYSIRFSQIGYRQASSVQLGATNGQMRGGAWEREGR